MGQGSDREVFRNNQTEVRAYMTLEIVDLKARGRNVTPIGYVRFKKLFTTDSHGSRLQGSITFSAATWLQYFKGATHLNLYFDAESNLIGLKPGDSNLGVKILGIAGMYRHGKFNKDWKSPKIYVGNFIKIFKLNPKNKFYKLIGYKDFYVFKFEEIE